MVHTAKTRPATFFAVCARLLARAKELPVPAGVPRHKAGPDRSPSRKKIARRTIPPPAMAIPMTALAIAISAMPPVMALRSPTRAATAEADKASPSFELDVSVCNAVTSAPWAHRANVMGCAGRQPYFRRVFRIASGANQYHRNPADQESTSRPFRYFFRYLARKSVMSLIVAVGFSSMTQ